MTDSNGKKCPLCIENGLMTTILWQDDEAYLCRRVDFSTGAARVMENEYMFVSKHHTTTEPSWLAAKAQPVLKKFGIEPDTDYANHTKEYGKLLEHFHRHYIVRADPFGIGLNGMITLATQQRDRIQELETELAQTRRQLVEARRTAGMQLTGL